MTRYWCLFLDLRGNVFGAEHLDAGDDKAAIAKARVIFKTATIGGYEI
jgi:hypothetical protein